MGLGSQTGGSTIRPASFNGIYAIKPTWSAVSSEGQRLSSITLDTIGFFARSVNDLELFADAFNLQDDEDSDFKSIHGARFAVCKTVNWPSAGEGTQNAMTRAVELLRAHGAIVDELELPPEFDNVPAWQQILLHTEGQTAFFPELRLSKKQLDPLLVTYAEGAGGFNHRSMLTALDGIAALRPQIDAIAGRYAAIITPSTMDEAPEGLESTGNAIFCSMWTALHTPVVNIPGFQGAHGMPIGVSLVAPRYRDRHLLNVAKEVGKIYEAEGGWVRKL